MCLDCGLSNNRTPTPLLKGKTPYECLFGSTTSCDNIRIFSCLCYAKNWANDKLASRSRKCVFVGYPFGKKRWKVYDLERKEIFVSRDIEFCEEIFPLSKIGKENSIERGVCPMRWLGLVFSMIRSTWSMRITVVSPGGNVDSDMDRTQKKPKTGPTPHRPA